MNTVMPNTYTQTYIQLVFGVNFRQNLIQETFRERLEMYMCGIIRTLRCKTLAIYCNPDHTHVLIGINPTVSIADLAKTIKANSSRWINENNFLKSRFSWQEGYGAFSYSRDQIDRVAKYIFNQPEHHRKEKFKDEYLKLLAEREIAYDEKYLFEWYE